MKTNPIPFITFFLCLAAGCSNSGTSSINNSVEKESESKSVPMEEVTLTFIQHTFFDRYNNDETNEFEYKFKNDTLMTSEKKYEKGHYLTKEEIDKFAGKAIDYTVPKLNGDGYYTFTHFLTQFNEETGVARGILKPSYLNEDLTLHFAIYG